MTHLAKQFDVIIIGGGHAGCEAAAASARVGAKTCLLTQDLGKIGEMSCNPAFGGVGKGHLLREIDALDGLMARAGDEAAIHYRLLNRARGPAVQGPRVQADRLLFRRAMQTMLRAQEGLTLLAGEAARFCFAKPNRQGLRAITGVELTDGTIVHAKAVVLASGTFLGGRIHQGAKQWAAGRLGEKPANALADALKQAGLACLRLKTGTPPRLAASSIDFAALERQSGDEMPEFLSFLSNKTTARQACCHITRTNEKTHAIIADSLKLSPVYSGQIKVPGPRYCPSIEDKIARFPDRTSHQIFLEPEGLPENQEIEAIYPNGISTALPPEVQQAFIRTLAGLEQAQILQYGYAIDYVAVDPRELDLGLQVKKMPALWLAGQINGTTGYEEAGAQGLLAGVNAARHAGGQEPVSLRRREAYLGVMADDLITTGITEPYRMFTSRAEYRLSLRADNADLRLTPKGLAWGCVGRERAEAFSRLKQARIQARALAEQLSLPAQGLPIAGVRARRNGAARSLLQLISSSGFCWEKAQNHWPELAAFSSPVRRWLEAESLYGGYLARQDADIARLAREEQLRLPQTFDYHAIPSLPIEAREKLDRIRPTDLAQAGRIEGVGPAALAAILVRLKQGKNSAGGLKGDGF